MIKNSVGRRAFLKSGTLFLMTGTLAGGRPRELRADSSPKELLKIGLVTDLHYADKPTRGTRHYRESLSKLSEATARFQQEKTDFIVELGDLIDTAPDLDTELGYLKTIHHQLAETGLKCHFVLGNHCVERLTKEEFLTEVQQERSYYSFDRAGQHFIILDACFRGDGVPYGRKNSDWKDAFIPQEEIAWLKQDLKQTDHPTIVFAHQRLDVENHYAPHNSVEIREILESSEKVSAVFQGHSHANDYKEIHGIHYCTLAALIEGPAPESNSYSTLTVSPDGVLQLTGFRHQKSYDWKHR